MEDHAKVGQYAARNGVAMARKTLSGETTVCYFGKKY